MKPAVTVHPNVPGRITIPSGSFIDSRSHFEHARIFGDVRWLGGWRVGWGWAVRLVELRKSPRQDAYAERLAA